MFNRRTIVALLIVSLVPLSLGCSDNSASSEGGTGDVTADRGRSDSRRDAAVTDSLDVGAGDATDPEDATEPTDLDEQADTPSAQDLGHDTGPQEDSPVETRDATSDIGTHDTNEADASDVALDLDTTRPPGICAYSNSACMDPAYCTESGPGGSCGCGAGFSCPGAWHCDEDYGVCKLSCDSESDCPLGWRCDGFECRIQNCSGGVCPTPIFGCASDNGICQRFRCDAGCPSGTRCCGTVCVETSTADEHGCE